MSRFGAEPVELHVPRHGRAMIGKPPCSGVPLDICVTDVLTRYWVLECPAGLASAHELDLYAAERYAAIFGEDPAQWVVRYDPDPRSRTWLADALAKPVSIEFKDASLKQVFEVLACPSDIDFVFDKDVKTDEPTTIYLRRAIVKEILNAVLQAHQLERRTLEDGSLLIYSNTPAKACDHQALTIKTFYLANTEPKAALASLRTLLKAKDVVADEKQNLLVMRDTPETVRLAGKLLTVHDLPEPRVMLEVEILQLKRSRLLDLGIRWPDLLTLTPLATAANGLLTLADIKNATSRTLGATITPLSVSAGQGDTDINLLANPRIRTRTGGRPRS